MKDERKFEKINLYDLGAVYLDTPGMKFSYRRSSGSWVELQDALDKQTLQQRLNILYTAEEEYRGDAVITMRKEGIENAITKSMNSEEIPENVWAELSQSNNGDFIQLLIRNGKVAPAYYTSILDRFWEDTDMMSGAMLFSLWSTFENLEHIPTGFFLDKALSGENSNLYGLSLFFSKNATRFSILIEHTLRGQQQESLRTAIDGSALSEMLRPVKTLVLMFKHEKQSSLFRTEADLYQTMQHTPFRQLYKLYTFAEQLKNSRRNEKIKVSNDAFMEIFSNTALKAWATVAEEEQMKYFEHDDRWVRTALALNPNLSEEITEMLADDEEVNIQRAIAMREDLAQSVLEDLATSRDALTRILVAINKNTPLSVLMNFFNDDSGEYADARDEAMLNPNFSKDVLMAEWVKTEEEYKRSNDPKAYRRMMMLVDSSLWEYNELMDILETYGEEHNIRFAVLQNPAIPPSARVLFVNDWSDYVGE